MSTSESEVGRTSPIPRYIFIGEAGGPIPEAYRARWHDEWGFFARITPNHFSGHYPVPLADYLRAVDAYADFIEKANTVGDLSEQEQAVQREFVKQLGVDPGHTSIPAVVEAACRATKRRMLAHARYEAAKSAWEGASRDAQNVEEIQARERAFAAAVEDHGNGTQVTVVARKPALHRTKPPQLQLVCP